jgi:hypothetical protein
VTQRSNPSPPRHLLPYQITDGCSTNQVLVTDVDPLALTIVADAHRVAAGRGDRGNTAGYALGGGGGCQKDGKEDDTFHVDYQGC